MNGQVSPQREANRDRLVRQEQAEGAGGRGRGAGGEGTRGATSRVQHAPGGSRSLPLTLMPHLMWVEF